MSDDPVCRSRSLEEFMSATSEHIDWLITGLLARQHTTIFYGLPKIGKSSLTIAMCVSILRAQPFLGLEAKSCGILYATERGGSYFKTAITRGGLTEQGLNMRVIERSDILDLDWPEIVTLLAEECRQLKNPGLVVIDTLPAFVQLAANGENDSATMVAVYRPLDVLLQQNLAVLLILHSRRSDGKCRGSNASQASCDVILGLHRLSGNQNNKNLRLLDGSESRFSEITPAQLVYERNADGSFVARGTSAAVTESDVTEWLREHLPATEEAALTEEELLTKADGQISRVTLRRALSSPAVIRVGAGRKHAPFRYYKNSVWRVKFEGEGFVI